MYMFNEFSEREGFREVEELSPDQRAGYEKYDFFFTDLDSKFVNVFVNRDAGWKYFLEITNEDESYEGILFRTFGDYLTFLSRYLPTLKLINDMALGEEREEG